MCMLCRRIRHAARNRGFPAQQPELETGVYILRRRFQLSCDGFREGVDCPHGTSLFSAQTSVSSPSEPVFDSHLWLMPEFCDQLGN